MVERYVTTSVAAFVEYVAAHCLPHGYHYYVSGVMPEGKDYRAIDARIIAKYDIAGNRWERCRRKRAGEVNLRYLRCERWYLILATGPWGQHLFFESEADIRDVRVVPIRFHGYELSYRAGRVWVRIAKEALSAIREHLLRRARRARVSELISEFQSLPYQPYRSVRYQLFVLLREVNRRRKAAGLARVPEWAVPGRRTISRIFEPTGEQSQTMGW